jgi:hypothetical protein
MQGIKVTGNVNARERDAVWNEVVSQVAAQGCGLGHRVEAPPVMDDSAVAAVQGPPRALGR